jgi:hypothetical protein
LVMLEEPKLPNARSTVATCSRLSTHSAKRQLKTDFLGEEDVPPGQGGECCLIGDAKLSSSNGWLWIVNPVDGTLILSMECHFACHRWPQHTRAKSWWESSMICIERKYFHRSWPWSMYERETYTYGIRFLATQVA